MLLEFKAECIAVLALIVVLVCGCTDMSGTLSHYHTPHVTAVILCLLMLVLPDLCDWELLSLWNLHKGLIG